MKTMKHLYHRLAAIAGFWVSEVVVRVSGNRRKSKEKLEKLKNKYCGQRCFIIGNGPSLRKEDLELLSNEVTFASNRIFRIFDQTQWRPTYYCRIRWKSYLWTLTYERYTYIRN